jgi:hypothetical protein
MRKITLALLALAVSAAAYCGVPQAINYQAVVQNTTTGSPIKDKTVSLRLSILLGSPTGAVNYEETQTVTTDGIGVVAVNIGTGTEVSGTFAGINWSSGIYYLKTEVDTNGGSNYVNVGTLQFFSVPYALYASNTNFASSDYPDGINNITPINLTGSFSYLVPSGQTLYITNITYNGGTGCNSYGIAINGATISSGVQGGSANSASSSDSSATTANNKLFTNYPLEMPAGYAVNSTSCGTSLTGFTIPTGYTPVVFDLSVGNYTVPTGKILVIKNMVPSTGTTWSGYYTVGSNATMFTSNINFVDQSTTISTTGLTGSLLMMGYLKTR